MIRVAKGNDFGSMSFCPTFSPMCVCPRHFVQCLFVLGTFRPTHFQSDLIYFIFGSCQFNLLTKNFTFPFFLFLTFHQLYFRLDQKCHVEKDTGQNDVNRETLGKKMS